jgi:hypothetical protein
MGKLKNWLLTMLALLAFVPNVKSAPIDKLPLCHAPEELEAKVSSCDDNAIYSEAAVLCLEKIDKNIEKAKSVAALSLKKNTNSTRSAQDGTLAGGKSGYEISVATLEGLLLMAQKSKKEIEEYKNQTVFPEHFGEPAFMKAGKDQFLAMNDCYSENQKLIRNVVKQVNKRIRELESALVESRKLEGISGNHQTGLVGEQKGAPKTKLDKESESSTPKGPSYRKSDITGTEKLKPSPQKQK